jgi:HAD superfamily hydrolase (TIGR01509 family)
MTIANGQRVSAIIFDVGGVLAEPGAGQFPETFFGGREQDSDHPWHRLERGELTMAQAMPLLPMPPGRPRPPRPYTLKEDYVELAEQLAEAGFKLALCTNTPREAAPLWQALYPWGDVFEVIIRSCDVGARKPDVRMVRAALDKLGSAPEETLFVDDLPANRESASTLGVTTIDGGGPSGIALIRQLTGLAADAPRKSVGPRGPRRPPVRNRGDRLLVNVLFDESFRADPFPLLHELRELSPMHQLAGFPIYYTTRYEDCREVLRNPDFVKATEYLALDFVTGEAVPPPPAGLTLPLAFIDPPDHTPVRRVMASAFTRKRMDTLRPWLKELATDIVRAALAAPQPVNVVEAIAYPLAMRVICDMVGVTKDKRHNFRTLMRDASVIFEPSLPPDRMYDAVNAIIDMTDYFTGLGESEEGLLRDLLREARAAGDVTPEDVIANISFLFFAGFETVAHLLSATLFLMGEHPEQYDLLLKSPDLAERAAQEISRYHSPVQTNSRIASRDLDFAGVRLPAGTVVVTMLAAANRDPAVFPDPDRFDITRPGPLPLTFGGGIHYCLGFRLALLEATVILESLVEAGVRRVEIDRADWKHAIVLRGFDNLDLRFS